MRIKRPDYTNPPIRELSCSLQFEPIAKMHLGYLGGLWSEFSEEFPAVDHAEELQHEIERFGGGWSAARRPRFRISDVVPSPRMIMTNTVGDRLLQAQRDRFVFNWLGNGSEGQYPGFKQIATEYKRHISKFESYISKSDLGPINFNQAELTKVNHVAVDDNSSLSDIIEKLEFKPDIFPEQDGSEFCILNMSHKILNKSKEPVGRLYSRVGKEYMLEEDRPVYVLKFVARANLESGSLCDALATLDELCRRINSAFEALTTSGAKEIWGKKEL